MLGRGSLLAYLVHMTLRIVEIHRVLRPTGSFYLHCDPTASHYLKLVLDAVFCGQGGDFLSEIVWKRQSAHSDATRKFAAVSDTILLYSKSSKATFNVVRGELDDDYVKKFYRHVDEQGRRYRLSDMSAPEGGGMAAINKTTGKPNGWHVWNGYQPPLRGWRYSPETLDRLHSEGRVYCPTDMSKRPALKRFLDENQGQVIGNVWTDISPLTAAGREALGYPTQKPEALLERIIKASSNEDDTVLDAYCGCGTTIAVAQRLGRRWIGIDITYQSIALILKRFADTYKDDWPAIEAEILLDGVPKDIESAMALANRKDDKTRKEFEKWAVLTFSKNQARINEKKGADGGVDGIAYFLLDKDTNGKAIFQVKSRPGNRGDLATLNSDRLREKAEFGFLICTSLETKPMRDEIAAAGKFRHPLLNREDDRLQVITVAELFAPRNVRLDLPMARSDAVKAAAAQGDADKQLGLI